MVFDLWLIAQAPAPSGVAFGPIAIFTAALAWASLWCQLVVLPFYNKGESLHKDYWATGRINAALAAIEADRLIPALVRMFLRAIDEQTDKRKRLADELPDLLQSVEFLPDLKASQDAVSAMDGIRDTYKRLKLSAARLWKVGLCHVLLTPVLPALYIFGLPLNPHVIWGFVNCSGAVVVHALRGLSRNVQNPLSPSQFFRIARNRGGVVNEP
jgi:hypothetical protein